MEALQKFKKFSKRVYKQLANSADEENADFNFTTEIQSEKLTVSWRIRNLNECRLETGQFYESPPFSAGFAKELMCTLRLYPKGRKNRNKAELFVFLKTPESRMRFDFKVKLILDPVNNSQQNDVPHFSSHKEDGKLLEMNEDLEEMGMGDFALSLCHWKSLTIRCHFEIYYEEVYDNGLLTSESSRSLSNDLKVLFETGKFDDSKIQVGKESFPVHRAVLAARSEVFGAMFKPNTTETETKTVDIEDLKPSIIRSLLHYIYTGEVEDLTVDKAIDLYPAADKYFIEGLMKLCVEVLLRKMTPDNVCQIAILADKHGVRKLKTATNFCFRQFKHEILQKKQWKKLIKQEPQLASDILRAISVDLATECVDARDEETDIPTENEENTETKNIKKVIFTSESCNSGYHYSGLVHGVKFEYIFG